MNVFKSALLVGATITTLATPTLADKINEPLMDMNGDGKKDIVLAIGKSPANSYFPDFYVVYRPCITNANGENYFGNPLFLFKCDDYNTIRPLPFELLPDDTSTYTPRQAELYTLIDKVENCSK